ncbi:LacI family transcriptional regulator [Motilibacter rhizosphaerae]|uniref:LacI family transcriptional regulator n=1 Tax=Motilibacter rhizosphaerae TaxID=598652 RepID=A0A4Q7NX98_9ACTN|nr:LacI family DNA-binding transcriptional regulator [Motilibacter rhizosphaerae]RZS91538.1 LacI family transcriptional regulator [Motilibacter rhizosphaerae]
MRRAATMGDVASLAGVSHQTVSRVLNDSPAVRPETRERVLAAIEQLGYRRNIAARALVTRRSQTLGVVSFGTRLYGPTTAVHAIEQAARQAGYYVSIASEEFLDATTLRAALERLAEQAVEGIVVIAPQKQAQSALAELPDGVPAVVIDGHPDCGAPRVYVDQVHGAADATRHLLDQGVTTVHHVAGPLDWLEADARVEGWRQVLQDAGRPVPELRHRGDWSAGSGYAAGLALAEDPTVEAVFVANDPMALGVLRALSERGRRCPEDILVVGFDDVPESAFYLPPLTTVRQDFPALGRKSIDLLLAQIQGSRVERSEVVPAQLVVRTSSRRPEPTTRRTR